LPAIVSRLIAGGRRRDEPVAIISNASTPRQQVLVSTLGEIPQAASAVATPAIIVIGQVVRLRAGLDWLGALSGRQLDPDPLGRGDKR
jgi:uroporphyrin-III C-methyltransferase